MKAFENHSHWSAVKGVCGTLRSAGYEALLAGGSVRDLLMNREPHDFDVATNATPDQVEALYPRAVMVGRAFGVSILPFDDFQIEVATFREDLEYRDGRRPEGVKFSTAEADAKRRDFTVNALFYDIESGRISDYVGGEADLRAKCLRAVGDPELRFEEDKLRLMRAVRFAAQLDFEIEPRTLAAVKLHAADVSVVSRERIRDEILKLLAVPHRARGLELLQETGLLKAAFPASAAEIQREFKAWLERFRITTPLAPAVALALFFIPSFKASNGVRFRDLHLKGLKLDGALESAIEFSLKNQPILLSPSSHRAGEVILLLKHRDAARALALASVLAASPACPWPVEKDRDARISELCARAQIEQESFLSGDDLKGEGLAPGPRFSEILREAQLLQLENRLKTREEALAWLKAVPR